MAARRRVVALGALGLCAACTWVLLLGGRIEVKPRYVPAFELHERTGQAVLSTDPVAGEVYEQEVLFDFLEADDRVVNLGGAKGTSCIFIEKIVGRLQRRSVEGKPAPTAELSTVCVEPDASLVPTLTGNFEANGVSNIHILSGMFAGPMTCPPGVPLVDGDPSPTPGARPFIQKYGAASFEVHWCFSLGHIRSLFQGRGPTVLFADCEGCLPGIVAQFPSLLQDPSLRLVIFERDGAASSKDGLMEDPSNSHYAELEATLAAAGFNSPLPGAWVSVWQRGSTLTLRVWCVPLWMLTLTGLMLACDLACGAVLPPRIQTPAWRLLVLMAWRRALQSLQRPLATTLGGLLRPIVGWQPFRMTSFAISNFLFMWFCIMWPLAEESAPKAPRRALATFVIMVVVPIAAVQLVLPCESWFNKEQMLWQLTIASSVVVAVVHILLLKA